MKPSEYNFFLSSMTKEEYNKIFITLSQMNEKSRFNILINLITDLYKESGFHISKVSNDTIALGDETDNIIRIITINAENVKVEAETIYKKGISLGLDENYIFSQYSYFSFTGHQSCDNFFKDKLDRLSWKDLENLIVSVKENKDYTNIINNIKLYNHNIHAYNKAKNILDNIQNRVAIIQPTGTGKMYVAYRLMQDAFKNNKRIVYLTSNNYIVKTLNTMMANDGIEASVKAMTYHKLHFMKEEDKAFLNPSQIYLDEYHRAGAPEWGKSIQEFIQMNPTAQLIGTTATPKRTEGSDISGTSNYAQSIFHGSIAREMYLLEAIAKGILPEPKYIASVHTLDIEIKKIVEEIKASTLTDDEKKRDIQKVKRSRINFEKSGGIIDIFKNNVTQKDSRFIVFCEDIKHMEEMMPIVSKWFEESNIYDNINSYSISNDYTDTFNEEQVYLFEKENVFGLNLLFSINKVNEGIHFKDISGVIMLRKIKNSMNLFYQQIGRAFETGSKRTPIIFDLTNNYSLIKENTFISDLNEAIKEENKKRNKNKLREKFYLEVGISENISNVFNIFETIRFNIQSELYRELVAFKTKFGYSARYTSYLINAKEREYEERLYARFIEARSNTLNKSYFGRAQFSQEQKSELEKLGYVFKRKTEKELTLERVIEFFQKYNREPETVGNRKGKEAEWEEKIYKKFSKFRYNYFHHQDYPDEKRFTDIEVNMLKKLGFLSLENIEAPEKLIRDIERFYEKHKRVPKQYKGVPKEEIQMVRLFRRFRDYTLSGKYPNRQFNEEQIQRLRIMGFEFKSFSSVDFVKELITFKKENNSYPEYILFPKKKVEKDSKRLAKKMYAFYKNYLNDKYVGKQTFSKEDVDILLKNGFVLIEEFSRNDFIEKLFEYLKSLSNPSIEFIEIKKPFNDEQLYHNKIYHMFKYFEINTGNVKYGGEKQFTEEEIQKLESFQVSTSTKTRSQKLANILIAFRNLFNDSPRHQGKRKVETYLEHTLYINLIKFKKNTVDENYSGNNQFNEKDIERLKKAGYNNRELLHHKGLSEKMYLMAELLDYAKKEKEPFLKRKTNEIKLLYSKFNKFYKNSQDSNYVGDEKFSENEIVKLILAGIPAQSMSAILKDKLLKFKKDNERLPSSSLRMSEERTLRSKFNKYLRNSNNENYFGELQFNKSELKELKDNGYPI